jgi:hypothetical protein
MRGGQKQPSVSRQTRAGLRLRDWALFVCQGGVIMITDLILQDHPPPVKSSVELGM